MIQWNRVSLADGAIIFYFALSAPLRMSLLAHDPKIRLTLLLLWLLLFSFSPVIEALSTAMKRSESRVSQPPRWRVRSGRSLPRTMQTGRRADSLSEAGPAKANSPVGLPFPLGDIPQVAKKSQSRAGAPSNANWGICAQGQIDRSSERHGRFDTGANLANGASMIGNPFAANGV
jgi:hypothetical protein